MKFNKMIGDRMKNSAGNNNNFGGKVVAVWGTNGAGKSSIITQIAVILGADKNLNILVVDFDTLSPSLDHYFGISKDINYSPLSEQDKHNKGNSSLGYAYDAYKRGIFDAKLLKDIVIEHPLTKNLHVFTGNYQYNLFELFNEELFNVIIEEAKKIYDIILIDTNSVFFVDATFVALKKSNLVYAVAEADYTSLREVNRAIDYLKAYMPKEKFEIIINKYTNKHIDKTTIKQTLEDFVIGETVESNEKHIISKIYKKPFVTNCSQKEKKAYINIADRLLR